MIEFNEFEDQSCVILHCTDGTEYNAIPLGVFDVEDKSYVAIYVYELDNTIFRSYVDGDMVLGKFDGDDAEWEMVQTVYNQFVRETGYKIKVPVHRKSKRMKD
jgi:uncharacterized protein YrzB (UPF0473 family)